MDIENLSDQQLHQSLLNLKSKESQVIAYIISHLEEVYRRRLFAHYKCSSLYDYCIRILGYSNGEAHKKISACKLASSCEGVKESIASGELSLSNAASIQVFLNRNTRMNSVEADKAKKINTKVSDAKTNSESSRSSEIKGAKTKGLAQNLGQLNPRQIVERVKNKTTRECEVELEKIASENHLKRPEKKPMKRNYGDKTQLKIYLDRDTLQLLKARLGISCEQELLQVLVDEKLRATEPQTEIKPKIRKPLRKPPSQNPRSISPAKRAAAFKAAQKQCENCGSKYFLQVDHKMCVAMGGGNDLENLRVLCRSCNQRAAIDQLGLETMEKFINKKPPSQKANMR